MGNKLKERDFRLVPLEELKTPREGKTVYLNRYWLTYKGCAMFYRGESPQCNAVKEIAEHVRNILSPVDGEKLGIEFVESAYVYDENAWR